MNTPLFKPRTFQLATLALAGALACALTGCTIGPRYQRPDPPPLPAAYKEPPPANMQGDAGAWKQAQPADETSRGKWWELFGDPKLNELEERIDPNNQNLRQYEAQYRAAVASIGVTRAGLFPTVTGGASVTGSQGSTTLANLPKGTPGLSPSAILNLPFTFSYQADVWGKVRKALEANVATAQASAADLETIRLSLHALLAENYLQLRGLDSNHALLETTVDGYVKALDLTTNRYQQGVASKLDVVQAQTQIDTTRAELIDTGVLRAQYEHAIAVLLGVAPADFKIDPLPLDLRPPVIPAVLPATLLERRPDIAAAERRVAAANAEIGVAMAAFYPTLSFSAAAALEGNSLLNWFTWPSRVWSVGPAIAQTLFEAGGRKAVKAEAVASYDALAATYRQTVLTALQGVEDNLSTLRILEQEERQQLQAVDSAAMTTQLSMNQYRGGVTNYLQVITAQALELSNRITLSNIETRRMVAAVLLVQNLGGGWSATSLPQPQQLLPTHRPGWRGKMFPDSPPDLAPAAPNPPAAAKP